MPVFGFHAHPVPDSFRRWLPELGIDVMEDDGFPLPQWTAQAHLEFMDAARIDTAVLSLPTPHIHHGNDAAALNAAREINDELAAIHAAHPDRFLWTACLPLPYVEGSVREVRRCLDEKGACGVKIPTNLPFCSHGGGRFGQSLTAIAKLAPDAMLAPGLSVHYSGGSSLAGDIRTWLESQSILTGQSNDKE